MTFINKKVEMFLKPRENDSAVEGQILYKFKYKPRYNTFDMY